MKKARKLNLHEMWDLYLLIGEGEEKEYLIDEMYSILDRIPRINFIQMMQILYKGILLKDYNPVEMVLMLVRGFKKNKVFLFSDFIKEIVHDRSIGK